MPRALEAEGGGEKWVYCVGPRSHRIAQCERAWRECWVPAEVENHHSWTWRGEFDRKWRGRTAFGLTSAPGVAASRLLKCLWTSQSDWNKSQREFQRSVGLSTLRVQELIDLLWHARRLHHHPADGAKVSAARPCGKLSVPSHTKRVSSEASSAAARSVQARIARLRDNPGSVTCV